MRRRLILAGAGLAILLAASLGLIAWLTSAPPSSGTAPLASGPPPSGTTPAAALPLPPLPPSGAQGRPAANTVPDKVVPKAAKAVPDDQPQPEPRPGSTSQEPPQVNRRAEVVARRGVRADLRALEPRLIECARLARHDPSPGRGGRTVLLTVIAVQDGRGTVLDVLVRRRGTEGDPVVHCARGALMGQSFPVEGIASGTEVEVPLAMPVIGDEPDRGAR